MVMVCPSPSSLRSATSPRGRGGDAHTAHQNVCRGGRRCPPETQCESGRAMHLKGILFRFAPLRGHRPYGRATRVRRVSVSPSAKTFGLTPPSQREARRSAPAGAVGVSCWVGRRV